MDEDQNIKTPEKLVYDAQLSFLVPHEWKERLEKLAKSRWTSPSIVYREAILSYLKALDKAENEESNE